MYGILWVLVRAVAWLCFRFRVIGTVPKRGAAFSHLGKLEKGAVSVGDKLAARVDGPRRTAIRATRSATRL